MSDPMRSRKLFPRNATARSHHWVIGNPVTTRPESGVDNCFPGLEFDQRNLDKRFFPGLEFELHAAGGPARHRRAVRRTWPGCSPRRTCSAACASTPFTAPSARRGGGSRSFVEDLQLPERWKTWRIVHDLEPGPVAIALGPLTGVAARAAVWRPSAPIWQREREPVTERRATARCASPSPAGERARYLDADGVIDPADYPPGRPDAQPVLALAI